jgi:hypothetical protein
MALMKNAQCPNCKSTNLAVEKQPNGSAHCLSCNWGGKYSLCFYSSLKSSEEIIQEIEKRISSIDLVIGAMKTVSYKQEIGHNRDALESLLSWITQENNLDGLADD